MQPLPNQHLPPRAKADSKPLLVLQGISKKYPGCLANDQVDMLIHHGEIHALLGENGAGKSTLMKILYGVIKPDAGTLFWEGKPLRIKGPAHARQLGIGMVFQHFSLFETLTVAENIALSLPGFSYKQMPTLADKIASTSLHYGIAIDPEKPVHSLSTGERQRVEIVRCLIQDIKLLILDEPTSVLTPQETEVLFHTLRQIAKEGCSLFFISHKLKEVCDLCDHATFLRQGKVTAECVPAEHSTDELAAMMVGHNTPLSQTFHRSKGQQPRLVINHLNYHPADPFGTKLNALSLSLNAGEIVGIAGVAGNGQEELLAILSGEALRLSGKYHLSGSIQLNSQPIEKLPPHQRRKIGVAVVPEERLGRGAVSKMTLEENSILTGFTAGLSQHGLLQKQRIIDFTQSIIKRFQIKTPSTQSTAESLSGGNLQKFIIGREILQKPTLLIAAQPTWGVDVSSANAIRQALIELRDEGAAILLISQDIDELFEVCDRIGAICEGKLSPTCATDELSIECLGQWMAGVFDATPQAEPLNV